MVRDISERALSQQWDTVNIAAGRLVAWVRPTFVPAISFFDELDYALAEKFRVVTLQRYDATFQPGQPQPQRWEPRGISKALVVFQLAGQKRLTLPPAARVRNRWKWLAERRRASILAVSQRYAPGPATRSTLGTVLAECWDGNSGAFGSLVTGDRRWFDKTSLREKWRELVEGWELYLRRR